MAREEKRIELKPVEENILPEEPVVRLVSDDAAQRPTSDPMALPPADFVTRRLSIPKRDSFQTRTHEPGIEALIEKPAINTAPLESDWGKIPASGKSVPWGWFALLGVIIATTAIWSFRGLKAAEGKAEKIRETTAITRTETESEDRQATATVDSIEIAKTAFIEARSIEDLMRVVRQPDRVRPLIEDYYSKEPLVPHRIERTRGLSALTIGNHGNFWLATVLLENRETKALVVDVQTDGIAKIDWETYVCYQPVDWSAFATERPAGKTHDFRIYVEKDNLFTHEFVDSTQWKCYRLTALNSIDVQFGYARAGQPTALQLDRLIDLNRGKRTAMILRLTIPAGLKSRQGVVIDKVMSERWLYVDPPDTGP